MKPDRHEIITDLITNNVVSTQSELLSLLLENGVSVTQATVSRDIKEMRLVKRTDENGIYRYCVSGEQTDGDNDNTIRYSSIFAHSVISIDRAENIIVLKCRTGTAQAACAGLDTLSLDDFVGTLAGDDTIFALCRTTAAAVEAEEYLKRIIK